LRKRCPKCGVGAIFRQWYTVHDFCPICRFDLGARQPNTWAFMYISTAAMSGVIVFGMLLVQPPNKGVARAIVLLASLGLILCTLPVRKSLAIAWEYLVDVRWDSTCADDEPAPPPDSR